VIPRILLCLLFTFSVHADEIRVFAAASLMDVLADIARDYERRTGNEIVFNFAASSILARQIERGAPADLFLSADEAKVHQLGSLIGEHTELLANQLVIIVHTDSRSITPETLPSHTIAVAEPSSVPAGIYARAWLVRRNLWERVSPRLIPTENVRAALAAVASGNADAAIVYRTDAAASGEVRIAFEVPVEETPGIVYSFAVVKGASEAARKFHRWLSGPEARRHFTRHGFLIR
jgi:molybdate transport system substrate-binding protein